MEKRKRSIEHTLAEVGSPGRSVKRLRHHAPDRLSQLSDELIVRILSYLNVCDLTRCQRLSQRIGRLAADSQLWKALYYLHFVRPRAARIPGISLESLVYSSKLSKWLDEQHLIKPGALTNWKAQYKLRLNWTNGSSHVSELTLRGHSPPVPPLIRMRKEFAVSADNAHGLRVWKLKDNPRLLTYQTFRARSTTSGSSSSTPTSIALDDSSSDSRCLEMVIGFEDGGYAIYGLAPDEKTLVLYYQHPSSINGKLSAMAYNYPYLATASGKQILSLYRLHHRSEGESKAKPPRLVSSMRSHTAQSPLSISLRILTSGVTTSVAYVLPSYSRGWTVGLQESRFTMSGDIAHSRTTTALHSDLSSPVRDKRQPWLRRHEEDEDQVSVKRSLEVSRGPIPTALSYAHPYMVVSHADNTLTMYVVRSTDAELVVSAGQRLWGHTSSVSDVLVGDRGRAVSASRYGDEIRVWELEGTLHTRKRPIMATSSVSVRPPRTASKLSLPCHNDVNLVADHRVVGFDQEKVVTMREADERTLLVYDFS